LGGDLFTYHDFDPVAFTIGPLFGFGPLAVRWYGIMYLVGFTAGWFGARSRAKQPWSRIKPEHVDDIVFYVALGAIVGGRIGYMLVYGLSELIADPLSIFKVWQGGMSFHGGLLGVLLAMWILARRFRIHFLDLMDFVAPLCPLGLAAGRFANFINGELWGRVTDVPWGMVFRGAGPEPRHPSQLYQFALEGLALFALLWWYSAKPRARGRVSGLFLLGYGVFRFAAEFAREPDAFLGYLALGLTMGQWLCLPMIAAGGALLAWNRR
jgi:phosphatidylglycerol:prolipoprotein diacylglycerol transferase